MDEPCVSLAEDLPERQRVVHEELDESWRGVTDYVIKKRIRAINRLFCCFPIFVMLISNTYSNILNIQLIQLSQLIHESIGLMLICN